MRFMCSYLFLYSWSTSKDSWCHLFQHIQDKIYHQGLLNFCQRPTTKEKWYLCLSNRGLEISGASSIFFKFFLTHLKIMESLPEKNKWLHEKRTIIRYIAVILLQIVTVSPWTCLVKNHESLSRTNESQLKTMRRHWKCLGLYVTYYQTLNLKTDSKALYYSVLN